jgi:Uma2 family endonuclease
LVQLLDGEIVVSPPPIPRHQLVVGNTYMVLRGLIPNGKVFMAPIALYFDEDDVPEPDVLWVAAGSRCVVAEKRLEGPPELIVEVLGDSTARYDKTVKFLLYEKYGVGEYWIADPETELIEVWRLEGGEYVRQGCSRRGSFRQRRWAVRGWMCRRLDGVQSAPHPRWRRAICIIEETVCCSQTVQRKSCSTFRSVPQSGAAARRNSPFMRQVYVDDAGPAKLTTGVSFAVYNIPCCWRW